MSTLIDPKSRSLGPNLKVGPLGYGCWRLVAMQPTEAQARIETALELGMNLIDTADVYGLDWGGTAFGEAERILGEVLAATPSLRDRMVLASKGGIIPGVPYDSRHLTDACEASLSRLQVDSIDLYQIHRPDLLAHPAQVAEQLTALRAAGKIREVGVSNHRPSQTAALQSYLDFPIVSQQPEYSAVHLDPLFDGTFDDCLQHDQLVLCCSPLAGGRLATGDGIAPALLERLDTLAEREGVSRSVIATAFTLAHPAAPVSLVGSINLNRMRETAKAKTVTLDAADVYAIIEASMGESLP